MYIQPNNRIIRRPAVETRSLPLPGRYGKISITSREILADNQRARSIAVPREYHLKVKAFHDRQRIIEEAYFEQAQVCPIKLQKNFQNRLGKIQPQEFKSYLQNRFYDPTVMRTAMCITEAIAYSPPVHEGGVASNFRIRRWIRNLNRVGAESVEGYALRGDFDRAKDTFIVKAPRDPENPMLLHEYFVGVYGLNQMRSKVPNFAYVLGGFRCSPPIIDDKTKKVEAWCNNTKYPIDYVIYENIAPAKTMRDWVVESCNFTDWLSYYLQILYATQLAAEKVDYTHYDLHDENVLRREINDGQGNIRQTGNSGQKFAIPYTTETGKVEYIMTDAVATIIDFGLAHIKYQGRDFGVYDRLPWAVLPTRAFPLHDAYKFLLMSMRTMLQAKKMECFNQAAKILRFFNSTEDPKSIVNTQAQTFYYLPFTAETASKNIYDLTKHIRQNLDTSRILVSSRPTSRILGCQGTDVCLNSRTIISQIGATSPPMAANIFDFYDLVSRLSSQNKNDEVDRIIQGFNYGLASIEAKKQFNQGLRDLTTKTNNLTVYSVNDQPLGSLLAQNVLQAYRSFISQVANIYDTLQELDLLQMAIIYAAQIYNDKVAIDEVSSSYRKLRRDYDPTWNSILGGIQTDIQYLESLLGNSAVARQINQAVAGDKSLGWWWNTFPEIMRVIQ